MRISEFMKETLNKWVKIENEEMTIIQNVKSYEPTKSPNMFKCKGVSVSNSEGETLELDEFYMSKYHLEGKITEISQDIAETQIQEMKHEL